MPVIPASVISASRSLNLAVADGGRLICSLTSGFRELDPALALPPRTTLEIDFSDSLKSAAISE